MVTQRFFKYIVSERGRSTTFNAVCVAGVSMFTVSYLPHTIGITKLREFLQLYRSVSGIAFVLSLSRFNPVLL